jgi:hypothetical protein
MGPSASRRHSAPKRNRVLCLGTSEGSPRGSSRGGRADLGATRFLSQSFNSNNYTLIIYELGDPKGASEIESSWVSRLPRDAPCLSPNLQEDKDVH